MRYEITEISTDDMERYGRICIAFTVESILEPVPVDNGIGGLRFREKKVSPYVKDYELFGSGARGWHKRFDTSNWVRFAAVDDEGKFLGGAVVAYNTDNVNMLEDRDDITVLWDIRVETEYRGSGIGTRLFKEAAEWSKAKGCKMMKIETQNININACRFYSSMGCRLGAIRQHVYTEQSCRDEVQLLWYYDLKE